MKIDNSSLFEHTSYVDFLKSYYKTKNQENSCFNLSVWSRKLGLSETSTLARILNGDRVPGKKLTSIFIMYFGFSERQSGYFQILVKMTKEKDHLSQALFTEKLNYLREATEIRASLLAQKPLIKLDSKVVLLWGSADPVSLNRLLNNFGLESIINYGLGRASVCIKGAVNKTQSLGTYTEFNFLVYVKKVNEPLDNMSMFIDYLYCPEPEVIKAWRNWEVHYNCAQVETLTNDFNNASVRVFTEDEEIISFKMGNSTLPIQQSEVPIEMRSYSSISSSQRSSKISIAATSMVRDFDSEVDHMSFNKNSKIGNVLESIDFRPVYWSFHPKFKAQIFPLAISKPLSF